VAGRCWLGGLALLALAGTACGQARPAAAAAASPIISWRRVGSWSGHGSMQTGTFNADTGSLRVRWRADVHAPSAAGRFLLTAHSAVSGRPLAVVVEHEGGGDGVAYVTEQPRLFHFVVESADTDWSFSIEEAHSVQGSAQP
jgi:hypothetical protein